MRPRGCVTLYCNLSNLAHDLSSLVGLLRHLFFKVSFFVVNGLIIVNFKSESMGAPGRRATCCLSDFDETWPV